MSEQHAAARFWAAHGLPVCRLIARDKRPTDKAPKTTGTGPQHRLATTDLDEIDRWWLEVHPRWGPRAHCNPGLPTGPWSGFLALDVDRPGVFETWLAGRPLPPTLRWSSCRSDRPERYTLLFKYPLVAFSIRSVVDGRPECVPGVDLRAEAEHVVLPGAVHARGSVYAIQQNVLATDLPAWLLAELEPRSRSTSRSRPASRSQPRSAGPLPPALGATRSQAYANALRLFERAAVRAHVALGQRHRTLIGLSWEGLTRGLRAGDVRRAVLKYVDRACRTPADRREALRQLDEALARPRVGEPNEPRFSVEGQARWLLDRELHR